MGFEIRINEGDLAYGYDPPIIDDDLRNSIFEARKVLESTGVFRIEFSKSRFYGDSEIEIFVNSTFFNFFDSLRREVIAAGELAKLFFNDHDAFVARVNEDTKIRGREEFLIVSFAFSILSSFEGVWDESDVDPIVTFIIKLFDYLETSRKKLEIR